MRRRRRLGSGPAGPRDRSSAKRGDHEHGDQTPPPPDRLPLGRRPCLTACCDAAPERRSGTRPRAVLPLQHGSAPGSRAALAPWCPARARRRSRPLALRPSRPSGTLAERAGRRVGARCGAAALGDGSPRAALGSSGFRDAGPTGTTRSPGPRRDRGRARPGACGPRVVLAARFGRRLAPGRDRRALPASRIPSCR